MWPWPAADKQTVYSGVTRWTDRSAPDGTLLDLIEFDFGRNPRLRLELYDQDEDDPTPGDNTVDYWRRGVGVVTRDLNRSRGRVVAAWNGLFFGAEGQRWGKGGIAYHVAPVVLNGRVLYNVGNHRWTFGVDYRTGAPEFKTLHLPDRASLAREFTYGAGGAQCLVREGRPLQVRPFPKPDEPAPRRPIPSTPAEAGHIPDVDHIGTSRTSMGWSQDHKQFYLLLVHEPDHEAASNLALRRGLPVTGGWTVADLQRFWMAKGVSGAVNIDGGNVTQATCLRPDRRYDMITPRWTSPERRLVFDSSFKGAPEGGTLMYFYVREARRGEPTPSSPPGPELAPVR